MSTLVPHRVSEAHVDQRTAEMATEICAAFPVATIVAAVGGLAVSVASVVFLTRRIFRA